MRLAVTTMHDRFRRGKIHQAEENNLEQLTGTSMDCYVLKYGC
jgi:hypothetical protein